jgi:hypothetical protein
MPNFNDAEITRLYVAQTAAPFVKDDAPNAPAGGAFDVTMEMAAGGAVAGPYTLVTTCADLSAFAPGPAVLTPGPQINGPGNFQQGNWVKAGPEYWTFSVSVTIPLPAGAGAGHVYQYTAALTNPDGQVVSIVQSDPFVLL